MKLIIHIKNTIIFKNDSMKISLKEKFEKLEHML